MLQDIKHASAALCHMTKRVVRCAPDSASELNSENPSRADSQSTWPLSTATVDAVLSIHIVQCPVSGAA